MLIITGTSRPGDAQTVNHAETKRKAVYPDPDLVTRQFIYSKQRLKPQGPYNLKQIIYFVCDTYLTL